MSQTGGYVEYAFAAEFYDPAYSDFERKDVEFFVELSKETGGPVLEIGCGTGRVLMPTAEAGIEITGLDVSEYMLKECRKKINLARNEVRDRIKLVKEDMRSFDLGREFKLITTPFRPFQHLVTIDDQFACLNTIYNHLSDDGLFVLDIFNPSIPYLADESRKEEFNKEANVTMSDGRSFYRTSRTQEVDFANQVVHCELIYYVTHPDGREERLVHEFPMRYIFRWEAQHMLARCGFKVRDLYADFEKAEFGSKYPGELIFICEKVKRI